MPSRLFLVGLVLFACSSLLHAGDDEVVQGALQREVIGPRQALVDLQEWLDARIPRLSPTLTREEWDRQAPSLRAQVLDKVVFGGEAAAWRKQPLKVEWLDTMKGGEGYELRKLRYEAAPGMWIPAILYQPEKLTGKVPVVLNVNGHDGNGKAAPYKQTRCINLAKRGMLALNVEWVGMGQLRSAGYRHGCMNQLDLCGTSGLSVFFLNMSRGLDVLLGLEHADPKRVAVTGLSGGGWQTIFLSSLDPRVTLCNPVAGYSSLRTRIRHFKDLGDSEQTPCDLAVFADYTHLTALMAPRPTLLTYCAKDDCCFEAGYALPPLLEAAGPIFKLHDQEKALRSHINTDPGTHNYEKDNRQAFYRMVGDFFYPGDKDYKAGEIECASELKTKEDLAIELPAKNADFQSLALELSKNLPRQRELPSTKEAAVKWQSTGRIRLGEIVRGKKADAEATKLRNETIEGLAVTHWKLKLGDWTLPVVELVRGEAKGTTLALNDAGRRTDAATVRRLLQSGQRVLAVDPLFLGETRVEGGGRDWLFALLVASVGERALGLQAHQVAGVARWAQMEFKMPVNVSAIGPRTSVVALTAAALEPAAVAGLELHGALGGFKELIEQNRTVEQYPELFCFGLLEQFDVAQLVALVAPRPVRFVEPSDRTRKELAGLKAWYALLGKECDPLK
jgi:dienelactone hydrolase